MSKIKKLIEVALPLDAINKASAREKSIRHGHPSTLHLWWARRPLAAARAVLFATLVDDPSSHPDKFPTSKEQDEERHRLFEIIEKLVVWENTTNKKILDEAYEEIKKYTDGNPPPVFDPFAGGGTIPLEAQRLGLKAIAADLNPVAVMINKAMIELPVKFKNALPINPESKLNIDSPDNYQGAMGLAADISYYGELLKKLAFKKIGHLYPKIKIPSTNQEGTVIAWLWARTIKCPNPACGCDIPLIRSFWLSKKKGKEVYIEPVVSNKKVKFEIKNGVGDVHDGTVSRNGAKCICCGENLSLEYIREEGKASRLGSQMLAIVVEVPRGRLYLPANDKHIEIANVEKINDYPTGEMPNNPRWFSPPAYGFTEYHQLFTKRQLKTLVTFSDLIDDIKEQVILDGGTEDYGKAIAVYLSFAIDRMANRLSSQCIWNTVGQKIEQTFGRQAIAMTYDFAEANVFSNSTGSWSGSLEWIPKCVKSLPASVHSNVLHAKAQSDCLVRNVIVSTDPPYYDNIGYADLSDFFYIWLRRSLKDYYPEIFSTLLVPKKEELIATPYRFDGNKQAAKDFFENGMTQVCKQLYQYGKEDYPVTIYYAFKQSDTDSEGTASTGWETMLNAIIKAGFSITGTWPLHTERETGLKAHVNALASSIVLVCRKRKSSNGITTRKNFMRELKSELQSAISHLQISNIAPVDMAQSAIGPGISVYSKYDQVLEADGAEMSVRTALQLINQELDAFFGGQSDGLDAESRFSVELFTQAGLEEMDFGTADVLARAKNTSVAKVADTGAIISGKGKVRIAKREEMTHSKKEDKSTWMSLQRLAFAMEREGIRGCAKILLDMYGNMDYLKNLAYHMYQISEEKHLSQEAGVYNNLVISWNEILSATEELRSQQPEQMNLLEV